MSAHRQSLGRWGESLAADYLAQQGYTLIERNQRTPYGEIDLIVRNSDALVFVEVKTRSNNAYGLPEASITPGKRRHLLAAVQAYLQANPQTDQNWRIDVIAIRKRAKPNEPEIVHFENALT